MSWGDLREFLNQKFIYPAYFQHLTFMIKYSWCSLNWLYVCHCQECGCRKSWNRMIPTPMRQQADSYQEGNMFSCLTPFFCSSSETLTNFGGECILTCKLFNYWLNQRLNSPKCEQSVYLYHNTIIMRASPYLFRIK